jgi:hypothetical protein
MRSGCGGQWVLLSGQSGYRDCDLVGAGLDGACGSCRRRAVGVAGDGANYCLAVVTRGRFAGREQHGEAAQQGRSTQRKTRRLGKDITDA